MTEDSHIDFYRAAEPGDGGLVTMLLELPMDQAEALAQLLKRQGWDDWRSNAKDDAEACRMRDACEAVRRSLAEVGIAPR